MRALEAQLRNGRGWSWLAARCGLAPRILRGDLRHAVVGQSVFDAEL